MEEDKLKLTIEQLRLQLCKMVKEKGISDTSVLALSQELDIYIVQYQRRHARMKNSPVLELSLVN
ncbi:aspartyl-phosphate phosphatase Spo0E family protein [Brevibacillus ruminantium]|uniref:Aspartyl-phosphate phosphatase Spo0E family protein n=1 Tax=Brevibacillus ruminantium TaxID=2950604 RepID=A0ABY4WEX3_9BACL|nr:aspartyl-phosphate phosphatase Spo0E family protein [Brevibacillus ruminantium]USG65700.1 aspartyl-phosphate phosphatase Spo0E family protein [Brevibacillus ruminantium]